MSGHTRTHIPQINHGQLDGHQGDRAKNRVLTGTTSAQEERRLKRAAEAIAQIVLCFV